MLKNKHVLGIITGVVLGISMLGTAVGCGKNGNDYKYSRLKINQLSKLLDKSYLGEIDNKKTEDSIYAGYVNGLEDPMTRYLNEEELEEQQVLERGEYIGTGIQFQWALDGQGMIVTNVIPNSPADRVLIKQGDKIIEIDEIKVMLSNEVELQKKLIYTGDEEIIYTVKDNDGGNERKLSLRAEVIEIKGIEYELINKNIGYISIFSIKQDASEDLMHNIEDLKIEGAQNFIIDIRNAYSNNIEEIYKLCNLFINQQTVFKVTNKQGETKSYLTTEASYTEPLVVLVNGRTRGAIEAFAAAVNQLKRGVVIGEASAGMGLVSEVVLLEDHTGLMISTGIIYTPSGISLKDTMVTPDIVIKNGITGILEVVTKGKMSRENDLQLMEAINHF